MRPGLDVTPAIPERPPLEVGTARVAPPLPPRPPRPNFITHAESHASPRLQHALSLLYGSWSATQSVRGGAGIVSLGVFSATSQMPDALAAFERERRPVVEKIVAAANASSFWYERLREKMNLEPWQLAYDYMTRSGRMTDERLRELSPKFTARVDQERKKKGERHEP